MRSPAATRPERIGSGHLRVFPVRLERWEGGRNDEQHSALLPPQAWALVWRRESGATTPLRAGQEALVTRSENFHAIREFLEMRFGREAKLFHLCGKVPGPGLVGETGAHALFECFFLRTKRQSDDFP